MRYRQSNLNTDTRNIEVGEPIQADIEGAIGLLANNYADTTDTWKVYKSSNLLI